MSALVFFGGRHLGSSCLEYLIEINCLPEYIVFNPDDKGIDHKEYKSVKKLGEDNSIKVLSLKEFSSTPLEKLFPHKKPTLGLSAFCSRLIPAHVINFFTQGVSNFHFSLLPKYRGQYPTVYTIFNNDKETGVTLHWITPRADDGDIFLQEIIPLTQSHTGYSLFHECVELGLSMFKKQIEFFQSNQWPSPWPQDKSDSPLLQELPNKGLVDWNWSKDKIELFFRAMYYPPYPLATFEINGKSFKIFEDTESHK